MAGVELIVLDLDGGDLLERLLLSVARQTVPPRRLIVVDNGSTEPVSERIGSWSFPVEVIRLESNTGFTGGVNEGFRQVESDLVGLVNNDVELAPRWIEKMVERLDSDPSLAAVQSVILANERTIDGAGISVSSGTIVQIGHGRGLGAIEQLEEPWGVSATAALYRAEAIRSVSPVQGQVFDSSFFAWYEDVELCARLRKRGWRFALVREPLAYHRGSATAPRLGRTGQVLRVANRYRVAAMHEGAGRTSSLLWEDLRRIVRHVLKGEGRTAMWVVRGVLRGLRER